MKHNLFGALLALSILATVPAARAESIFTYAGGKLLLTGGVSQVEGAAGGGLTPWAVIGGYGAQNQTGGNAFYTTVDTQDYRVTSYGALVGIHDRVEISYARQDFDLQKIGGALGLGDGYTISQDTIGVKVKIAGNAVLEQDRRISQSRQRPVHNIENLRRTDTAVIVQVDVLQHAPVQFQVVHWAGQAGP